MNDKNKVLALFKDTNDKISSAKTPIMKEKLQYKALGILQCAYALGVISKHEYENLAEELV
jgi:DNA-binding MltR family transcriptional regulator